MTGFLTHEVGVHQAQLGLNQPKPRALRLAHAILHLTPARQWLGETSFNDALDQLERMRAAGNTRAIAAFEQARAAMTALGQDVNNEALLREEALAYLVQNEANRTLPLVRRILAALRAFLYRAGFRLNLTENDLSALAKSALRTAAQRANAPAATTAPAFGRNEEDAEAARQYADVVARYTLPNGTKAPGWLKAPNGKPTNLNERQWVQVRTRFFKDWFGDWELMAKPDVMVTKISGQEIDSGELAWKTVTQYAEQQLKGKTFKNVDTGFDISVSGKGIREASHHARTQPELQAFAALPGLLERAVLVHSAPDRRGRYGISAVHTFYAPLQIGTERYRARLVVRDTLQGNRYYLHRLEDLQIEKPDVDGKEDSGITASVALRPSGSKLSIAQLLAGAKLPDGGDFTASRVVDESGEPRVVYRGTPEPLGNVFEYGKNYFGGNKGFWFTTAKSAAKDYSFNDVSGEYGEIKEVFLNIRNFMDLTPLKLRTTSRNFYGYLNDQYGIDLGRGSNKEFRVNELYEKHQGDIYSQGNYDGIVLADVGRTYIAKLPTQIKSAIGNTGAFSPVNSDIRYAATLGVAEPTLTADELLDRVQSGELAELTPEQWAQIQQAFLGNAVRSTPPTGVNAPSFQQWFGKSKIKKKDGKPLVMYHGTTANFTQFDASKAGASTTQGTLGPYQIGFILAFLIIQDYKRNLEYFEVLLRYVVGL